MKTTPRWMKSVHKAAADCTHEMPWTRGKRRTQMIARRDARASLKASA